MISADDMNCCEDCGGGVPLDLAYWTQDERPLCWPCFDCRARRARCPASPPPVPVFDAIHAPLRNPAPAKVPKIPARDLAHTAREALAVFREIGRGAHYSEMIIRGAQIADPLDGMIRALRRRADALEVMAELCMAAARDIHDAMPAQIARPD